MKLYSSINELVNVANYGKGYSIYAMFVQIGKVCSNGVSLHSK